MAQFVRYVKVSEYEWWEIQRELGRIPIMEAELTTYRESAREYMAWSLGGGMAEAIFAGMELARQDASDDSTG